MIGRAVLGIDAAWTAAEPSGVALAVEDGDGWRLVAAEPSYNHFILRADGSEPGGGRPKGAPPNAAGIVEAASTLAGRAPDCVGVDMPLGPRPIVARRFCDDDVSRRYGARKAAVHSPGAARPGRISDDLRAGFASIGVDLRTAPPARGLIEVYPHAALIEFMAADERLPYKAGKTLTYWPGLSLTERHGKLRIVWSRIVAALDRRMVGVAAALRIPAPEERGWRLKSFEDRLDAVVCACVAIEALDGRATAYGDAEGAIWVPIGGGAE